VVAEDNLALGVEHDHGVLEAVEDAFHPGPVALPVRLLGMDPLTELVHPRRDLAQLVVAREVDGCAVLAAGQPIHAVGDRSQRLHQEMTDDQPHDDRDCERDERDHQAVERGLRQRLLEEAGRDTDPHRPEWALALTHRHLRLVDLRLAEERGDDPERRARLELGEALARRQDLAFELGVVVDDDPVRRIDDGRVDDGVRVADHALEQGADTRILSKDGRRGGRRRGHDARTLVIELLGHQLALVRGGADRDPGHVREVRDGRRHHDQQDHHGERQNLPRAKRQTHAPLRRCTCGACCAGS
jgi:hypothetical protein